VIGKAKFASHAPSSVASIRNQAHLNQKSTARQSLSRLIEAFSGATLNRGNGRAVYAVPFASRVIPSAINPWHSLHRSQ
jgi:hypothetical protein